jgi:hypothetical protein
MSEYRFTDGNLLILYLVHRTSNNSGNNNNNNDLPDYIKERIKLGIETYNSIMKSRPDKHKTMVLVVGEKQQSEKAKELLIKGSVKQEIIAIDNESKNVAQAIDYVYDLVSKKPNPPFIYFIASVWLHDTFNASVLSAKMKNIRTQFYGALDHRPVHEVEQEKALDAPKKGREYYKRKLTNKAVDVVLNIIFPD